MTAPSRAAFARAEKLRDCVHCGLCSSVCPTYLETGNEADSPRGRIYLMQGLVDAEASIGADVVEHLDLCLGCRACETACPSGVKYGSLIEEARAVTRGAAPRSLRARGLRWLVERLFPRPALLAALLAPARWLERLGVLAVLRRHSRFARLLPPASPGGPKVARHTEPVGVRRGEAVLFEGCVARVVFADTNRATVRVLARNGLEVRVPQGQGCCGALLLHGDRKSVV